MELFSFLSSHQAPYTAQTFGQRMCGIAKLKIKSASTPTAEALQMPLEETYSSFLILLVTLAITSTRGNVATNGTNQTKEVTQLTQFQCHCHFFKMWSCSFSDFPILLILALGFLKNTYGEALLLLWLTIAQIAADVNVLIGIHGRMTLLYTAIIKAQFKPAFQFLCDRRRG